MLWITGAKGLLGRALQAQCKAVLHVTSGSEVDVGSLQQIEEFMQKNPGITHIINCAAFSQVDAAEMQREKAFQTNAIGPENLAKVAKLIHISTDYVFDGSLKRPLTEKDPVGPVNYYGKSKLEGEQRALAAGATVVRTSWIFGSGGKNFVSTLLKMLQTQEEIRLVDDQWGKFTYAPDLASCLLQNLSRQGLYSFANDGVTTKYEFGVAMREIAKELGFHVVTQSIVPVPASTFPLPATRPTYSALDTTKYDKPIRHWKEALRDFLCQEMPAYL